MSQKKHLATRKENTRWASISRSIPFIDKFDKNGKPKSKPLDELLELE